MLASLLFLNGYGHSHLTLRRRKEAAGRRPATGDEQATSQSRR